MNTTEEILQRLKERGYRFTGKRKKVVDLFVDNMDKYLTAKDIYDQVKESYPTVSYDTIYRTLALLVEMAVIEELEYGSDASRYRLRCGHGHHHHLVCLKCGSTAVVNQCPMQNIKLEFGDFTVVNHRFEIYGYCASCREKCEECIRKEV